MLIEDFHLDYPIEYVKFTKLLVWFRMYCLGGIGSSKQDYVHGFQLLQASFNDVCGSRFYPIDAKKRMV